MVQERPNQQMKLSKSLACKVFSCKNMLKEAICRYTTFFYKHLKCDIKLHSLISKQTVLKLKFSVYLPTSIYKDRVTNLSA